MKLKSGQVKVTRLLDGPIIHAGMDERMLKVVCAQIFPFKIRMETL